MKAQSTFLVATALLASVAVAGAKKADLGSKDAQLNAGASSASSESKVPQSLSPQTTCPVMEGAAIDKKLFVDHEGKRVYVCCKGCVAEVKKDPAKYIARLTAAGQDVEVIAATKVPQKTCPVMDAPIRKDLFADVDGKRIYVCCNGCVAEVKKNPAKYIAKLTALGEDVETIKKPL